MDRSLRVITAEENVARILFSPSHLFEGRVSPKAFKLEHLKGVAEDYISVLRYDADQLEQVSSVFRPRTEGDSIFGYTYLNVDDIVKLGDEKENRDVAVLPKPSKRLPWGQGDRFLTHNM